MLNDNLRRLSPEEIKANLPKILAAHNRKEARVSEIKHQQRVLREAAGDGVSLSLADRLKSMYRRDERFRSSNGQKAA